MYVLFCANVVVVHEELTPTYAHLSGRPCFLQIHTRTEARERYSIRGDTYTDCLTTWLCRPCSLTQERREIELEEGSFESDQSPDQ